MFPSGQGIVRLLTLIGLPQAAATIVAVLLIEERALGLDEISMLTGYAKSHVSTTIRLLEEKRLVERIRMRGRRVIFRARSEAVASLVKSHLAELRRSLEHAVRDIGGRVDSLGRLERALSELLEKTGGE